MYAIKILHKILKEKLPFVHKSRLSCLMLAVETLLRHNKLTLVALGRNILNNISARDNIKKIDRLLGNKHLYKELVYFYKEIANLCLKDVVKPWILIDWSCLSSQTNLYMLRATLVLAGRSIVLYEEVHPKKFENNHSVHKKFLNTLKSILPPGSSPIIVTDAGFRALWFKYVVFIGWDFVGRLRNKNLIKINGSKEWVLSSTFYDLATNVATYIGEGLLTQAGMVRCNFSIFKGEKKNRKKLNKNKTKSRGKKSVNYSKSSNEPWLIVSSLEYGQQLALKMVTIYSTRMQIEESIRDTKSQHGFRLKESLSRSPARMSILLLIGAIASLLCWLAGIQAKKKHLLSKYQTSSSKFTGKLSTVFLGKEVLKRNLKITKKQFFSLFEILRSIALKSCHLAF